jgi:thiamine-monophosphate kinase
MGTAAVRMGIGDDCAVLRPKAGYEVCVTTDFTLEERHFRRGWHPPESVGHRCLARGLSDLAAMGAEPMAVFLSLAVPARLPAKWLDRFLDGFLGLARKHRVALAGGDTAQSPAVSNQISKQGDGLILADVVAVGQVPRGKAVLRRGARVGDWIYCTGALGGAAAELASLAENPRRFGKITKAAAGHPHFYPEPRLAVGRRLRGLAHAMIDLSDGLSTDLTHLCKESGVAAVIDEAALPVHSLAVEAEAPLDLALHGGEDYELLFTAGRSARIPQKVAGVPIHRIGTIRTARRRGPRIVLETRNRGQIPLEAGGYEHFRQVKSVGPRSLTTRLATPAPHLHPK